MSLKLKELKKYLEDHQKDQLIKEIVYLAKQISEVEEYYHIKINPQIEREVFEKYKKIIGNEFSVVKNNPNMGYSVVNKAIKDFKKVTTNVDLIAELMLYYVEVGVEFTATYGDIDEKFYMNIEKAFDKALEYFYKNNLLEIFKDKVIFILDALPEVGWGFQESMIDIYYEYYEDDEITIRQETQEDIDNVYQVIKLAFENAEYSDHDEHNLVNRLRKSQQFIPELSLVAEVKGEIVGHILFTKIEIGDHITLALAPVSVIPEYQEIGIGSNLVLFGHHIARELGYVSVIVLGYSTFYPRFGYTPASKWNIKSPFEVPDESFMAVELLPNSLQGVHGVVEYPKEFFEKA